MLLAQIVLSFGTQAAAAQDDDQARSHFDVGASYYDQARYDDAAREFLEAYRLSARPELLISISMACERALRFDEAIDMLEQYLQDPNADDRQGVERRISQLRVLSERMASGQRPQEENTGPAPALPIFGTSNTGPNEGTRSTATPQIDSGGGTGTAGWVLVAAGGAIGIGALITGVVAHSTYADLEGRCSNRVCAPDDQDDIDTGSTFATLSTVLTIAAAVTAALGVVLVLMDSGGEDTVEVMAGPESVSLRARLTF